MSRRINLGVSPKIGMGFWRISNGNNTKKKASLSSKKLLTVEDMETYQKRFIQITNGEVERSPMMLLMRDIVLAKQKDLVGEHFITKLQDWQDDPVLFSYCQHPKILPYVESVIGPNIRTVHTMLINKPPDLGIGSSRHPPHQDLWYFPFRPADAIVCSWTAMQHINKQNGCLFVQPRTHLGPLYKHEYPTDGIVNKAYHGIQGKKEEDTFEMHHLEMEPGDTVFFHPLLIHGSGRNLTKGYRKAISCHYASTSCHFEDSEGTMQAEVAREIVDMAARKGVELSFTDLWRLKSRLVQGEDSDNWKIP